MMYGMRMKNKLPNNLTAEDIETQNTVMKARTRLEAVNWNDVDDEKVLKIQEILVSWQSW